jgi:hypothetical protein
MQYALAGESIMFKAGVPHKFWNAGTDTLKIKGHMAPPGNIVYFLGELHHSMNKNRGKSPGMYDAAFLLTRYKSEFGMLEIPAFVQRFIFPVILFFGNMAGKHKKFANAPISM